MAGVLNDSGEQSFSDTIRCTTYREMCDEMIARMEQSVVIRQWIAEILSQNGKNIITSASGVRSSNSRKVTREILKKSRRTRKSCDC